MKKGAVKIPNDAFDRTIEYLEDAPGIGKLKFKVHMYIKSWNLLSRFRPAHHFDSIKEFLEYQNNLKPDFNRVAFREVKIIGREDKDNTLEIRIHDGTGEAKLIYTYERETIGKREIPLDDINNPLHGAKEGDTLQIFDSFYKDKDRIFLPIEWYLKNDDHYRRMKKMREGFTKHLKEN